MSIAVMTKVWEYSRQEGSALLLLLAIADHAHDDGGGAWPSVETLAAKTRQTERNTQYLLRKLEDSGELMTEAGAGPMGCNAYRINLAAYEGGAKISPLKSKRRKSKRVQTSVEGVQSSAEGVQTSVENIRQISPEPSLTVNEPSLETSKESGAVAPHPEEPEQELTEDHEEETPPINGRSEKVQLYPIASAISDVCVMQLPPNEGQIFREARLLARSDPSPTPDLIRQHYGKGGWWYREDWRGKKGEHPTPDAVRKTWEQAVRSKQHAHWYDEEYAKFVNR